MVNSTGIMGQLENGSPVSSNHQGVNGGGYNPYTGGSGGSIPQATPTGPLNGGSDTLANLADLMGNNPGFPGFNEIDGMIGPRLQPHNNINFDPTTAGLLPPPQAVGGGMQPSTPGFDTDAFSTSILSGVGDLFQEYMGPQQETMPGALPMPFMPGGPTPPLSGPSSGQPPLMDTGFMPDGMNTNYNNASGIQSAFRGF